MSAGVILWILIGTDRVGHRMVLGRPGCVLGPFGRDVTIAGIPLVIANFELVSVSLMPLSK